MKKVTTKIKSSWLGNMRRRFGQSQQWWADYLGVSLAHIKMAETADRSLPSAATLKLAALETLITTGALPLGSIESFKQPLGNPTTATHKKLVHQSNKLAYQAIVAQQKLEAMQLRYQQACNSLAMATLLLEKEALKSETDKDTLALELLQLNGKQQAEICSPEAQTYLQWKIDCYTYGAARAKELAAQ